MAEIFPVRNPRWPLSLKSVLNFFWTEKPDGPFGSFRCMSDWWSGGHGFDPHRVWQHSFRGDWSWNIFYGQFYLAGTMSLESLCCHPLKRLFKLSWYVKTHDARGHGLFFLYIYIENFKILLVRNHDWFQYYLAGMLLWWPSTKIVQAIMIHQKKHGC